MRVFLNRLIVLGLLAANGVWAAPQAVQLAPVLQSALASIKVPTEKLGVVHYQNEAGEPIEAAAFTDQFDRLLGFTFKRARYADGSLDLTLRLQPGIQAQTFPRLKVGRSLPPFHLVRLDGTPVDLTSFTGKITLITFLHARCDACADMVPILNALAERRKDLQVLAFSLDGAGETQAFATRTGLRWPAVPDALALADAIGTKIPVLALFDRKGRLATMQAGAIAPDREAAFNAWLDRKIGAAQAASDGATYTPPSTSLADVAACGPILYPGSEEPLGHTADIRFYVRLDPEGVVKEYRAADPSGYAKLDQAVIKHLVTCRFHPVTVNGAAVEAWASYQLNWRWSTR